MSGNGTKDSPTNGDYIERVICKEEELPPENGMKVVDVGPEGKVLLVRKNGRLSALGTKCSHYGAPLVTGALGDNRIRCPWHGACFNINTGDIEDFPGLDSIPCYKVEVCNGHVKVKAKKSDLEANKRVKPMTKRDPKNPCVVAIIGSGGAGMSCAETLRQEGFTGRLVMISDEEYLPYERVKLSKALNTTPDAIRLRHESFFKEYDMEIMINTKAESLNTAKKEITLSSGESIKYDSLFIATGSMKIDIAGSNLQNVFTLRNLKDAGTISSALTPESDVVVYGSSFIGMEVAAYCVGKVKSVSVVGRSSVPFKEQLGEQLGTRIGKLFTDKGVNLQMGKTIKEIKGDNGKVTQVLLNNGELLPADVVVMGLGSTFATEFLAQSGIELNPNGSIPVNNMLETNLNSVYAGGDIAEAPLLSGEKASIGHWQLALYHGRIAALNIVGKVTPLSTVPFFWTMLFGTSIRYTGYGRSYTEAVVVGDLEDMKFAVYYCEGDWVKAVATVGFDPVAAQFAELLAMGGKLSKAKAQQQPKDWWLPSPN